MAPPDHLHGDGRGISQRPEDNAMAPVLDGGGFRGDAHPAAGRDDREPVIDVAGVPELRSRVSRPQVGGGSAGAPVDQHGALG